MSHLAGKVLVLLERQASSTGVVSSAYPDLIAGTLRATTPQVVQALQELEQLGLLERVQQMVILRPPARRVAGWCSSLLAQGATGQAWNRAVRESLAARAR